MVNHLRQLVSRYITERIAYGPFRQGFVSQFLIPSDSDTALRDLYRAVERACVAREHNVISEAGLRAELTKLVVPNVVLTQPNDARGIVEGVQLVANNFQVQWERLTPTRNTHRNSISTYLGNHWSSLLADDHEP